MALELGAFSISLSVEDLKTSQTFYEHLGFEVTGGDGTGYLIMKNGTSIIGLFHGMFEGNILTFNPGLNNDTTQLEKFTDVRTIQGSLRDSGIEIKEPTDPDANGPAHIALVDPDGNAILIDQFFPKPD